MVTVRTRGRLLHWGNPGAVYFVTFRLADSLPKSVLRDIQFTRQNIIRTAQVQNRGPSLNETRRLARLLRSKIETHLDAGAGSCLLRNPAVARTIVETLQHFIGVRYWLYAWCVMPNHVHVMVQPLAKNDLAGILQTWKSFSAKAANRFLHRRGEFWQREYYDHLIRNEKEFARIVRYVLDNPKKAGLQEWPWVGTADQPSEPN